MFALIFARRSYQRKVPHVPPEAGHEITGSIQLQDKGLLATRAEADDIHTQG